MNRNRKGEIVKYILCTLAVAGAITAIAVAPALPMAFAPFVKNKHRYNHRQLKRSLSLLERRDLVETRREGEKTVIKLTKNGQKKTLKYRLEDLKIEPQKSWDKKWRLVIFDIPKELKTNSYYFSRKLKEIGFVCLQKSVWACPYPCENEIDFLKEIYEIDRFVRIVTAESIDFQNDLVKKFGLT